METFQKRFIQAKEQSSLQWVDIATHSGLDKASISQYKNGVHTPEPDALYRLSNALDASIEWLTGGEVSVDDFKLLNRYRQLNGPGRQEFMRFLDGLLSNEQYRK